MLESLPPKLSKLTSAPYSIQRFDESKLIFKFVPVQPADGRRVDWDVVFVHVHGVKCTLRAYKSSCSVKTGRARRPSFRFLEVPKIVARLRGKPLGIGRGSRASSVRARLEGGSDAIVLRWRLRGKAIQYYST